MSIIDNIKNIADVVRKAGSIDLYRQILDLQQEALELVEENPRLKNEINKLIKNAEIDKELIFKDNYYYNKGEDGQEGPYCSNCWDNERKLIRVHTIYGMDFEYYQCPTCEK